MRSASTTSATLTSVTLPLPEAASPGLRAPRAYANPYLAGVGLGLVLLATFLVMGHGIGASGAVASVVTAGVQAAAPGHVAGNEFFHAFAGLTPGATLRSWLVFEVAGIALGGFVSAWLAGRLKRRVDRGPRIGAGPRLLNAVAGGAVMGFATRLARGCTSGLALTGGALLSVGAWVFMLSLFAGAYLVAGLVRRQWT